MGLCGSKFQMCLTVCLCLVVVCLFMYVCEWATDNAATI